MTTRWVKVALEPTFGSAIASGSTDLRGIRVTSCEPSFDQQVIYDETVEDFLSPNGVGGPLKITASLEMSVRPNQVMELLEALTGSKTTTGTSPYTHTFSLSTPKSLTMYIEEEETCWQLYGVGITSAEFTFEAREIVKISADLIGKGYKESVTGLTPSFSTESPFVFHEAAVLVSDVALTTCKSATMTIDRGIADDEYVLNDYTLSKLKPERTEITGRLRFQQEEMDELRRALFGTKTGTSLPTDRVIGKAILELRCISGNYQLKLRAPVAIYQTASFALSSRDRIERELEYKVVGDISITLVNDLSG